MKLRLSVIRFAVLASLFFVIFRLVFKFFFGGAPSAGTPLPSLPAISLPAPFSHIQLFGPVTIEGLYQTVLMSLPFALVILGFGFLSSLIDPVKLQAYAIRRNLPPLFRALGISVSAIPALVASAREIRKNNLLRGNERWLSYLVPILETSIERAFALAASLELASRQLVQQQSQIAIRAKDFAVGDLYFGDIGIEGPGAFVLTGPNGSGKSTLLRAFVGLASEFDGRATTGRAEIYGLDVTKTSLAQLASLVAYVPQNPRFSLVGSTIAEELSLRNAQFTSRFSAERELAGLSEGESRIFSIELALGANPRILLLDEPFTSLDHQERNTLLGLIRTEAKQRVVVIATPDLEGLSFDNNAVCQISNNGITNGAFTEEIQPDSASYPAPGPTVALEAAGLVAEFGSRTLFRDLSITANEYSITAIIGRNGSGKSTLLSMLANEKARLVPESFRDFFVSDSLSAELSYSDKVSNQSAGFTSSIFFSILNGALNQDSDKLLQTHPRDLSDGTQLALATAIQLAHKPTAILIDEPTRGFDLIARDSVARVLKCVAETGTAVVFATHDQQLLSIAHRVLELREQQLQEVAIASS